MNCLYITLFFNIVAGIFQTFIKFWNQLLYPRVIEVCRQAFEPCNDFFLQLIIVVELFPSLLEFRNVVKNSCFFSSHNGVQRLISFLCVDPRGSSPSCAFTFCVEKSYGKRHLAFGGTVDRRCHFKHVSLKQSSQVKDQGRRKCCHNKHKIFPYRPTRDVYLLSGHASYHYMCSIRRFFTLQIKDTNPT